MEDTNQINVIFQKAQDEINKVFDVNKIYKAAKKGLSGQIDDRTKRDIMGNLARVYQQIKGTRSPVVDWIVGEALKPVRINPDSNLPQYDLGQYLDDVKQKVFASLQNLKDEIMNQKSGEMTQGIGKLGKQLSSLHRDIGGLSTQEEDKAFDTFDQISKFYQIVGKRIQLISPDGTPIAINPKSPNWVQKALQFPGKRFSIKADGQDMGNFNIANPEEFGRVAEIIANKMGLDMATLLGPKIKRTSGYKLRTRKLRNAQGKTEPS